MTERTKPGLAPEEDLMFMVYYDTKTHGFHEHFSQKQGPMTEAEARELIGFLKTLTRHGINKNFAVYELRPSTRINPDEIPAEWSGVVEDDE